MLADGSVWHGKSFGYTGESQVGEVVFNTTLTGYQELLTDPSYKGQFVCYTTPHIGNVGINAEDLESEKVHLTGIVVRDLSCVVSNYRSKYTLDEYLQAQKVPGIANVDTRAITRRLRETGAMNGVIAFDNSKSDEELVKLANEWSIEGKDLISEVTCQEPYEWKELTAEEWEFSPAAIANARDSAYHIVAYDYGIKQNILRRLASFGCKVTVVPASYPAEKAMALKPDGVFFSNGPGDPSAVPYAVEIAKQIIGKVPTFGICMGHQIMGQAFGADTFKLKFGHHGGNHPIRYSKNGSIEISAQNHNYAVDPDMLPSEVEVTHINLNDGTCAGILCSAKDAMSIQYHPEASPGPHDSDVCFEQFMAMIKGGKAVPA